MKLIGKDILITVFGGDLPHIGAVAIAHPRPSLAGNSKISSSCSVICMLGHKEDDLAKLIAETIASRLNKSVVVTAGMHWNNFSKNDLKFFNKNIEKLIKMIIERIRKIG
ncbi:MAG: hypothetical protein GY756_21010 [bacterium]|nr:hypothetical protein [bacterium]